MTIDSTPVPTLSEDGWVGADTNSALKADYLLSHFFLSEYSQTHFFAGEVASLPWILQNNQNDMSGTVSACRQTLEKYLKRYYSNVDVEVTQEAESGSTTRVALRFYIAATDQDGKVFNFARLVNVLDAKILQITALNNGTAE